MQLVTFDPGEILNPMIQSQLEANVYQVTTDALNIFGLSSQRGSLLFFKIIAAISFEQIICQKTLFLVITTHAAHSSSLFLDVGHNFFMSRVAQ